MNSNLSRILAVTLCAATLVGSALAQDQGQGRRGNRQRGAMSRNGQTSLTQLVQREDVQKDLAVTDDQKTKLAELRPQRPLGRGGNGAGNGAGGNGAGGNGAGNGGQRRGQGANLDPAAMAERRAAEKKALEAVLNADQMKRLAEIRIQLAGDQAIVDPEVQKELGFSDEQVRKVKDLQEKYQGAMRTMREKMQSGDLDRQGMMEAMQTNTKVLREELHKIPTPAQADKLKALGGKPFQADETRRGGGRRGG
jgi:hypothetical protein